MPKLIEFEGKRYEFPDDFSQQEIATALGGTQQAAPQRGAMDKLTGQGGERYQTWPERLVRGIGGAAKDAALLPGRVMQEAQQPQTRMSDSDVSVMSVPQTMGAASFMSPVNPAVRAGELAIPGEANAFNNSKWFSPGFKRDIPTAEQLKRSGGAQIEQARNSGVEFTPQAAQNLGSQIEAALQGRGFNDVTAKETFGTLAGLRKPPDGAVSTSFGNLQNLREQLNKVAGSIDPRERAAANAAIKELDGWLSGSHSGASLAGSTTPEAAAQAASTYKSGRGDYSAYKRSADVTGRAEHADLRAAATNSGRNIDNLTRQRFVDILTNDAKGRGYSDPALEAIEGVVRGSKTTNAARYIGNLLGGGGGIGQTGVAAIGAGVGAAGGSTIGMPAVGAVAGAAVPGPVGASAKALANALTKRGVSKVDELIRMESPMYQAMPRQAVNPATQQAIIRALLGLEMQPQQ
jgi:hypothetical protein